MDMLGSKLRIELTQAGKQVDDKTTIDDLLVESIFDTDEIKMTKSFIIEI